MRIPRINLAVRLLAVIAFAFFFGDMLHDPIKEFLYAVSLSLKEILLFVMPIIIFSCLFSCILSFQNRAVAFILSIFVAIFVSNYAGIMFGYGIGITALENTFVGSTISQAVELGLSLTPTWDLPIPKPFRNEYALFAGLILGGIFSVVRVGAINRFANFLNSFVTFFLQKMFIPVLPLFALGFALKMQHEGLLPTIVQSYGPFLLLIVLTYVISIVLLYGIACGFHPGTWYISLRKALPAGLLGFSTMSSMAALPVNMTAAEFNTKDPAMARVIIPATVNVHLLADRIGVPMMILAVMATFSMPLPTFADFVVFAFYYALLSFAIAGVPGGGILVILQLLEESLGFTPAMTALITAIYIMFDPFITCGNVMGNGGFAIIFSKLFKKLQPT